MQYRASIGVRAVYLSQQQLQPFARIHGYVPTLRKQEVPVLAALEAILLGHPVLPSFGTT